MLLSLYSLVISCVTHDTGNTQHVDAFFCCGYILSSSFFYQIYLAIYFRVASLIAPE